MNLPRYFAYGSNMLTARLRGRVASARPLGRAELAGWSVRFDKRSVDGSGKCTIVRTPQGRAYGVLFELDPGHLEALDAVEGPGYSRLPVQVIREGTSIEALTYVARRSWIDGTLAPYDWYVELVAAGAREHALPGTYRRRVLEVEAVPDPNDVRAATARDYLAEPERMEDDRA